MLQCLLLQLNRVGIQKAFLRVHDYVVTLSQHQTAFGTSIVPLRRTMTIMV